ncbi:MAG TPA: lamin tail domain-containing protein [Phycisphaerales bacterium]|nr:lamin tail domain-containing protein [Phycisphaerales bacterium]
MVKSFGGALVVVAAGGVVAQPAAKEEAKTDARALHPTITEVLYAVPGGKRGDADKDGTRSATGDEFIELVNPHDKPIDLKGYVLTDGAPTPGEATDGKPADGKGKGPDESERRMRFEFPDCELAPGGVVVVFNGFGSSPVGPCGDAEKCPEPNPQFGGAKVFSMKAANEYQALSNQHDLVLLIAPDGTPVECIAWDNRQGAPETPKGKNEKQGPVRDKHALVEGARTERAPKGAGSVERVKAGAPFTPHEDIDTSGSLYSPGRFPPVPATGK